MGSEQRGQLAAPPQTQGAPCVFSSSEGEDKAPKSTSMHISLPLNVTLLASTWTVGPDAPVGTGIHWNRVHTSHPIGPFLDFKYVGKASRRLLTELLSAKARRRRRPSPTRTVSAPQPYELVLQLQTVIYSFLFFLPESCRGDASPHLGALLFKAPHACYGW